MKWKIDKSFDFCYGHRVHNQQLNSEFSLDSCLACRHLHGHQGQIKIQLESDQLSAGMVTDFKHLNWFKQFLDNVLDHKMILDINDPLLPHEIPEFIEVYMGTSIVDMAKMVYHTEHYWLPNLQTLDISTPQAVIEKYEGIVLVDFVPTSENLSAWLLDIASNKMEQIGVSVTAVDFWETPKSHCRVEK